MIDETQMPIAPEHAFKEKSTKLLILPSLRTIYNRTFQCETPCTLSCQRSQRTTPSTKGAQIFNSCTLKKGQLLQRNPP